MTPSHPSSLVRSSLALAALAALALPGCEPTEEVGPDATPLDTFTQIFQSSAFQMCAGCHAPGAPGATEGVEATQDWSSRDQAFTTLTTGDASGLIGNFEGCNGVPLIAASPEESLIVAVFDETIRASFALSGFPDCNADSISDMTLKIGMELPAADLALLKQWITDGAPNQ